MAKKRTLIEEAVVTLRAVAVVFSVAIVVAALTVPLSWQGILIVLCQLLAALAFVSPIAKISLPRGVGLAAIIVLIASIVFRITTASDNYAAKYQILPGERGADVFSRAILEEDGILLAARLLPFLGGITLTEAKGFLPALIEHYQRMRSSRGSLPTALTATVFGRQSPSRFDLLSFLPSPEQQTESTKNQAVILLHGTGGNWSLLCWLVAEPFNKLGLAVFCPSTGPLGMWGSESGEQTLSLTIEQLKQRGYSSFVLAGISAGAVGAGELIGKQREQFTALVLLFGSHPDVIDVEIPTLLVYGKADERFPAKLLEWVARKQRENFGPIKQVQFEQVPIDGGHFALVKQHKLVQDAVANWATKTVVVD